MDVDWIGWHLLFYVAAWLLMFGASIGTRQWLLGNYPYFAEPSNLVDPKPNPLPTSKKKFLISLYPGLCVLGVAFVLSLVLSEPTEDDVVPPRSWIDIFVLISCFMLYAVWSEIETYFKNMVEVHRDFKIFKAANLLSEWDRKWENYLHLPESTDGRYDIEYPSF